MIKMIKNITTIRILICPFLPPRRYTLTKASPNKSMYVKELHEDVQRPHVLHRAGQPEEEWSEGGEMPISDSVYRLYKSVDFYDCANRVVLEKASKFHDCANRVVLE